MAKKDFLNEMLEDSIQIARNNAAIITEIRNWCNHIHLEDISAGLINQLYQLPTNTSVSCPHSDTSSSGMQLNWIAASFINESCAGCTFHQPVQEPNFGSRLLELQKKEEAIAAAEKENKDKTHKELQQQIELLLRTKKNRAQIVELSILQMIDGLTESGNKQKRAAEIFEAAKIDPAFFPDLSLDALSPYFEDEQIGDLCLMTVNEILKSRQKYPLIPWLQAIKSIKEGAHFNDAALLFKYYIKPENISENAELIEQLFDRLSYDYMPGRPDRDEERYRNSIDALNHVIGVNESIMLSFFRNQLKKDDTITRVNVNGCLQDLMPLNIAFVKELTFDLVNSFELVDNATYDSADHACATTLGKMIRISPSTEYPVIKQAISKLSVAGRSAAGRLFINLLDEEEFVSKNKAFCIGVVKDIIAVAMKKGEDAELRNDYLDKLHHLRYDGPELLEPCFEIFLGWLSQITEAEETFLFWLEELKTKKTEEITTFNPLLGKNYFDIDRERNRIAKDIQHVIDILETVLKNDKGDHLGATRQVLESLDSNKQIRFKTALINLIWRSVQDSFEIAAFIPLLYKFLFDHQSPAVREEGMKFLDRLINEHTQLVTQTFLDLCTLFLKDQDVGVRGLAIDLQASILQKMTDKFEMQAFDSLMLSMQDKYVYVRKKMAKQCVTFFPLMNSGQKKTCINFLADIVAHYQEKEQYYAQEVLEDLLFISKDDPKIFFAVVQVYLIPNCKSREYYIAEKAINLLGEVKSEMRKFEDDWLKIVIDLFKKIKPGFRSDMDWRKELYSDIYNLSFECIHRHRDVIRQFIDSRDSESGFDVVNMLQILAYFELHKDVVDIIDAKIKTLANVKSTEALLKNLNILKHFSEYEESVRNKKTEPAYLNQIRDAIQEQLA